MIRVLEILIKFNGNIGKFGNFCKFQECVWILRGPGGIGLFSRNLNSHFALESKWFFIANSSLFTQI